MLFAGQVAGQFFIYSTSITNATGAANYILWLRSVKPVMQEQPENEDIGPNMSEESGAIEIMDVNFSYR